MTNNELGFDYLRDNMAIYKEQMVLRDLDYCIIDEVDSVLIDEARTPLIISGQSGKSTKLYEVCDVLARQLTRGEESGEFNKFNAIMGEEIEAVSYTHLDVYKRQSQRGVEISEGKEAGAFCRDHPAVLFGSAGLLYFFRVQIRH